MAVILCHQVTSDRRCLPRVSREPADPSIVHAHTRRPVASSRMIKACRVKKRQVGVVRRATATIVVDLKHLVLRINHVERPSGV